MTTGRTRWLRTIFSSQRRWIAECSLWSAVGSTFLVDYGGPALEIVGYVVGGAAGLACAGIVLTEPPAKRNSHVGECSMRWRNRGILVAATAVALAGGCRTAGGPHVERDGTAAISQDGSDWVAEDAGWFMENREALALTDAQVEALVELERETRERMAPLSRELERLRAELVERQGEDVDWLRHPSTREVLHELHAIHHGANEAALALLTERQLEMMPALQPVPPGLR